MLHSALVFLGPHHCVEELHPESNPAQPLSTFGASPFGWGLRASASTKATAAAPQPSTTPAREAQFSAAPQSLRAFVLEAPMLRGCGTRGDPAGRVLQKPGAECDYLPCPVGVVAPGGHPISSSTLTSFFLTELFSHVVKGRGRRLDIRRSTDR